VRAIKRVATRPLDVHLMIEDPDRYIDDFAAAGANMLSVHGETVPHVHRTINLHHGTRRHGNAVVNPSMPVGALEEIARDLDFVLVMSVNPGFRRSGIHSAQPGEAAACARVADRDPLFGTDRS